MSLSQSSLGEISAAHEYFTRSTRNLTEAHSSYAPAPGMMTVAQQVAHAAQTIDWFIEGAFRPEGFDLDFAAHAVAVNAVTSLTAAREWFDKAIAHAKEVIAAQSDADLMVALPPGPVMGGMPRVAMIGAITDHTAHHRGALTVYARLQGITPPMPYMDM
jgi:uncharacterized damage-inducible protein DinB